MREMSRIDESKAKVSRFSHLQSPRSGLHPDDFRQAGLEPELLGVVAFLGRVEDDTLNTRLMEWIGGKKDSVVCRVGLVWFVLHSFLFLFAHATSCLRFIAGSLRRANL